MKEDKKMDDGINFNEEFDKINQEAQKWGEEASYIQWKRNYSRYLTEAREMFQREEEEKKANSFGSKIKCWFKLFWPDNENM